VKMIKSGLIWVLLSISSVALAGDYVLPEPDHIPTNVSKLCFTGVVVTAKPGLITVKMDFLNTKEKTLKIAIGNKTSVFTVYGGYVMGTQLVSGLKLKVWYLGKSCLNPDNPLYAARIMLASEKPGDDWPRE
jgi:hypothetical protein